MKMPKKISLLALVVLLLVAVAQGQHSVTIDGGRIWVNTDAGTIEQQQSNPCTPQVMANSCQWVVPEDVQQSRMCYDPYSHNRYYYECKGKHLVGYTEANTGHTEYVDPAVYECTFGSDGKAIWCKLDGEHTLADVINLLTAPAVRP